MTGDARFCGTTASMCGIESAGFEQNDEKMDWAITKDVMLHAYMFTQSGIPMLYSGDEIGQVNDYSYKEDPEKAPDSRYIHRGKFNWDLVDNISDKSSVQGRIFNALGNWRRSAETSRYSARALKCGQRITATSQFSGSSAGCREKNSTRYLTSAIIRRLYGCRRKQSIRIF